MKCWFKHHAIAVVILALSTAAFSVDPSFVEQWKNFRVQHPYHVQVVGLSQPDSSQHRLLIITEPPPDVTVAGLQSLDRIALANYEIGRHRIGFNGWAKDVLVQLPPMGESDLELLVDKLHHYLFGTSYKAVAVPIIGASGNSTPKNYKFDLHVPVGNLAATLLSTRPVGYSHSQIVIITVLSLMVLLMLWATVRARTKGRIFGLVVLGVVLVSILSVSWAEDSATKLRPVEGGQTTDLKSIVEQRSSGVYLSEPSGLVVWSFPRSQALSKYRLEGREFSLDSDLIVGAVAGPYQVAVVGRERVVPIELLPPLRVETIMQLAAAGTDELAQSYERNNFFAGRVDHNRDMDWAPIYLSPQLINTEYGSLLNITDQLLKSWSSNGLVRYVNFTYPDPAKWPFPEPLLKYAKASEITFNWNTKGAGYSVSHDGLEVFALNRTGALPVDYLSEKNAQLQKAEDDAYTYFATQNDPNLVRVVQYASLYQIFRRFGVTAPGGGQRELPVPESLKKMALVLLERLLSVPDEVFDGISSKLNGASGQDSVENEALIAQIEGAKHDRDALADFRKEFGIEGMELVATRLAAPRSPSTVSKRSLERLAAASNGERDSVLMLMGSSDRMGIRARFIATGIAKHRLVLQGLLGGSLRQVMESYVKEFQQPEYGWIATPTIVQSHAIGKLAGSVGGHNLDSSISVFRASEDVPIGEIRFAEESGRRVVLHNPKDTGKVSEVVRTFGRENGIKTEAELKTDLDIALGNAKALDNVPIDDLLGFRDDIRPSAARGLDRTMARNTLDRSGYRIGAGEPSSDQRALFDMLSSDSHRAVVVEKLQGTDTYVISQNSTRQIFEAHDLASAQDAVTACMRRAAFDEKPLRIHLRGFDARQGKGFLDSAEFQAGEVKPRISARTIDEGRLTSSELREILTKDYDFKNATIEQIGSILEDEAGSEVRFEAKIPAKVASKPPLLLRIRIVFERTVAMTQEMVSLIFAKVKSFIAQFNPDVGGSFDQVSAFVADLERTHPGVKLDIRFSKEAKDIHIGDAGESEFTKRQTSQPA